MNESRTWTRAEIDALIDEKVKSRRWTANDITTIIGAVGTLLVGLLTVWVGREVVYTGQVAKNVNDRQIVHEQKTEDVKVALEVEKAAMSRKLEKIEQATSSVQNRIQVMGAAKSPP